MVRMNPPESVITHDSTGITLEAWVCHKTNIAYVSLGDKKSFYEYMIEDIHSGYTTHRGKECMDGILDAIRTQHPAVRTVEIYENTYLYGMMPNKETMDLSAYSVALYGKTWYEMNWNAEPKNPYNECRNPSEYHAQVEYYVSKDTKLSMEWPDMYCSILMSSIYTNDMLSLHDRLFEEIFHSTSTIPEFFIKMSTIIPSDKRICFFQYWLASFINRYITFDNIWIVTL